MQPVFENDILSGFKLEKLIQDGQCSWSYSAKQISLNRRVFIKILKPQIQKYEQWVKRFQREAHVCAMLKHPNIVEIYALGEEKGYNYIAMEYVKGRSLKDLLREKKKLTIEQAVSVLESLLIALKFVHTHNIIHRDIKPGNILIDNYNIVKITDFGLAYNELDTELTLQGNIVGTPAYMSPEQIKGEKTDQRSDLFSVGLVLYEMLTGDKFFNAKHYSGCINQILNYSVKNIESDIMAFPDKINNLIIKLVNEDKNQRFQNAEECLYYLEAGNGFDKNSAENIQHNFNDQTEQGKNTAIIKNKNIKILYITIVVLVISLLIYFINIIFVKKSEQDRNFRQESIQESKTDGSAPNGELTSSKKEKNKNDTKYTGEKTRPVFEKNTADDDRIVKEDINTAEVIENNVEIMVKPWGEIYIDGKVENKNTNYLKTYLSPGSYELIITNPAFPPFYDTLTVNDGESLKINHTFLGAYGFLNIDVKPWGEIYIDGDLLDTTPLSNPVYVREGKHVLEIVHPSLPPYRELISIKAKDTLNLNIDIRK